MNISFQTFYSNTFSYFQNKLNQLTPLQKKVTFFVIAYFSCATLGYTLYRCYSFNARRYKMNDDQREDINSETPFPKPFKNVPKPKIIIKPPQYQDSLLVNDKQSKSTESNKEDQLPQPSPIIDLKGNEGNEIDHTAESNENDFSDAFLSNEAIEEESESTPSQPVQDIKQEEIDLFIDQARSNEDFLSLLRCMADHAEWVQANMEQTTQILKHFGSKARFLQPIKVAADLYERLLDHHPELAFDDSLKNTEVIFNNKETYRTHLIFALKHLHVVRDMLDEEIPDISQIEEGLEIHLPGKPNALKAILQYLDNSDPSAINKIRFYHLIQMAHQYHIPSIWRYCESHISARIPKFPKTSAGDKEWIETLQLYASMKTQNVDFVIDYLFTQRGPFINKSRFELFFDSLNLDDLNEAAKMELKKILLKRNDILLEEVEVIREEHEDRLEDALVILEDIAERLSTEKDAEPRSYISCASVNVALKTIFKAAIAKQFTHDNQNKQRAIDALFKIQGKEKDLIVENTWRPFEWDKDEAEGIPSLAICLLNYLTQEVPDEIKKLSCWHGESLVLAFNDNSNKKTPLSSTVISYAGHAVSNQSEPGLYYLIRPSSRVASSKNAMIFTMTFNLRTATNDLVLHTRIEAIQNPINQQWLFRDAVGKGPGMTLDNLLLARANGLPLIPIPAPKTGKKRIATYVVV